MIAAQQVSGELDTLGRGEGELLGEHEDLPASADGGGIVNHLATLLSGGSEAPELLRVVWEFGLCGDHSTPPEDASPLDMVRPGWWTTGREDKLPPEAYGPNGEKLFTVADMTRAAELTCSICPAQWSCVRWALESKEGFHVWAVRASTRRRLAELQWEPLIDAAEASGTTVLDVCRQEGITR